MTTFEQLKKDNVCYVSENYGEDRDIFELDYILKKEFLELSNVDIVTNLYKQSLLDIDKFTYNTEEFSKLVNKEYYNWLNKNKLKDNCDSLESFKQDCLFRRFQMNTITLIEEIKNVLGDYLEENPDKIKCIWVSTKELAKRKLNELIEYDMPEGDYICLNGENEEEVLIAFKII